MCLYPRLIRNKKYESNQKNGGIIPKYKDARVLLVPIGCGKCIECKKQKANNWKIRLLEDVKYNTNGVFVTLTFNNIELSKLDNEIPKEIQGYARDNAICTLAVKRFRERWRKRTGKSPRHWLITELGHTGTERIHMHGIIWTDEREQIDKHWGYGFTWIQKKGKSVGGAVANYLIKYMNKFDIKHKEYKEIILCSAGIGKEFINNDKINYYKFNEDKTKEQYNSNSRHKMAMPTYYRNKLWTDDQREKLWINRINEEVRYVLGQKISIKNGLQEYYNALIEARKINKQRGFGDDEKNWSRITYENTIRNLIRKENKKNSKINLVEQKESYTFDISKYQTSINNLKNVF